MDSSRQRELERKINDGSEFADDFFDLGDIYFFKGMFEQTLQLLGKLRGLQLSLIDQAHLCQQEGEAFLALGRNQEAETNYRMSLEILKSPQNSFEYFFIIGRAHYTLSTIMKDPKECLDHSRYALVSLSRCLSFREYIDNHPERHCIILSWIGDMHYAMGQLDDAIKKHSEALELAENKNDVVGILADIAIVQSLKRDFKRAEKYFMLSISKATNEFHTTKIYYEMGKMYIEWSKLSKARESFRNAYDQLNHDQRLKRTVGYETDIIWYLGFVAYGLSDSEETINCMTKVLECVDETNTLYAESHLIIAHQYYKNGDIDKAREHYLKVLVAPQADPESIAVAEKFLASIPLHS